MAELVGGFLDLAGGMQRGIDPALHGFNHFWLSVNASVRGGILHTRAGLEATGIMVPGGNYQGGFFYRSNDGDLLVFVVDGEVWVYDLTAESWSSLGVLLDTACDKVYFCQANRFLLIQDNAFPDAWADKKWPVILDGSSLHDQSAIQGTTPHLAAPKGGPMAFGHGRLFVASPYVFNNTTPTANLGMRGWVAGDIIKAYAPEELLNFTENTYLNEGGQITLPAEMGEIRAMIFQQNVQNGVGQGPLIVAAETGFCVYGVNAPRADWKSVDMGQVAYQGVGSRSHRSFALINNDIFYRDSEGNDRTFLETANMQQRGFLNVNNLSAQVDDLVAGASTQSLETCSSVVYGNRHLTTVLPGGDGTFSGILVMDLLPVSAMNANVQPIWETLWTGGDFLEIFPAEIAGARKLLVVVDEQNARKIYAPAANESVSTSEDAGLESWIVTSFMNGRDPFFYKEFRYATLWVSEILSDATITVYYRPDRSSLWAKCSEMSLKHTGAGQNRHPLRFTPTEPIPAQRPSNVVMTHGFMHQFAIRWTGRLRIERARFMFESKIADFDVAKSEAGAVSFEPGDGLYDLDFYGYRRTT